MEAMELISLHSDRCRFCLVIMPVLQLALVLALAHTSWAQVPVCGQVSIVVGLDLEPSDFVSFSG